MALIDESLQAFWLSLRESSSLNMEIDKQHFVKKFHHEIIFLKISFIMHVF